MGDKNGTIGAVNTASTISQGHPLDEILMEFHNCIQIVLMSFSIVSHCVGLFAIHLHKSETVQNILLASLSSAELIHIVSYLQSYVVFVAGGQHTGIVKDFFSYVRTASMYDIFIVMYILILDRVVCVRNPLKYKQRVTRFKMAACIAASWVVSVCLAVVNQMLEADSIVVCLVVIHGVLAVSSYTYILHTITTSQHNMGE